MWNELLCVFNVETGEENDRGISICPLSYQSEININTIIKFCELCPYRLNSIKHKGG